MSKEILIPELRFPEFKHEGEWELTTIGDIGKFYYGKSAPKFNVGEVLLGLTSFATYAIVTIKESFVTSDKSFNSLYPLVMYSAIDIKAGIGPKGFP